ncbi:DUF58 domain-containing protein [Chloroflexota bacterium]
MRGSYWFFIAALLLIASLVWQQMPLFLISILLFLTRGVAVLWDRYCLNRVDYRRKLSSDRVFFGEEVQLEVEISNRKPLPLPWIETDDEVPEEVTFVKGNPSPSFTGTHFLLSNLLSLNWYHKVKRRYPLRCMQRGYFRFGPARVRSGDIFGFFRREIQIQQLDHLMVYPKIVPLERLGIPSKQPVGNIIARKHIFQDPILTAGVRDYHSGDSLKRIHWKSSARRGQLQSKVYEPTTTIDLGIFLDVRTMESQEWLKNSPLLEMVIVVAASMANQAITEGYRVGLYANQRKKFSDELIKIPPSQHTNQMMHILEALAQIFPFETIHIDEFVRSEARNLPWGSSLVVISAMPTNNLYSTLMRIIRAGRRVSLIIVGGHEVTVSQDGLTVYHVRDDVLLTELEMLRIEEKHHQ